MAHRGTVERIFTIAAGLPPSELSLTDASNLEKAQKLCWDANGMPGLQKSHSIGHLCGDTHSVLRRRVHFARGSNLLERC
jgi:hypothetical protein